MSREVTLHPLVIVNLSDHHTRQSHLDPQQPQQQPQQQQQQGEALGALLGIQDGKRSMILDSIELLLTESHLFNAQDLKGKVELFRQVYPRYELLGWYRVGHGQVQDMDWRLHKQLSELNESPLFLVLDVDKKKQEEEEELPVVMYESVLQVVKNQPSVVFVHVEWKIETLEAERITVEEIVGGAAKRNEAWTLDAHVTGLHNAVRMLQSKVMILKRFLDAVNENEIQVDFELLREADSVCAQLPTVDPVALSRELAHEVGDAHLVSYLSALTKGTSAVNAVLEKFFVANPTPGISPQAATPTNSSTSRSGGFHSFLGRGFDV